MVERLPDWEQRFHDYLLEHRDAVFSWGEIDCALFAAGCVQAITGIDFAAQYRGTYSTAVGSARALKKLGGAALEPTVDAELAECPPAFARRGDLVMHDGSLGVCIGADAVFVGEEGGRDGLVKVPRRDWSKAWKVG